jgi:hypothetical protein
MRWSGCPVVSGISVAVCRAGGVYGQGSGQQDQRGTNDHPKLPKARLPVGRQVEQKDTKARRVRAAGNIVPHGRDGLRRPERFV